MEAYSIEKSYLKKKYLAEYFVIVSDSLKTYTIALLKEGEGKIFYKTPKHHKRLRKEIFEEELKFGRIQKINLYSSKDK